MLESLGYKVMTALDGKNSGGNLSSVFRGDCSGDPDVIMPGMERRCNFRRVKSIDPQVRAARQWIQPERAG
ncbi:MAG: hypothetical protein R2874_15720 [Desulfobacterales bacterium]